MARGWLRNVPNEQYPLIKDETTVITPHSVNFLDTRRGADIPARRLCAAGCCARCSRGGFGRRYCGNGNRHRRGSCRGFPVRTRPECGRARRAYDPRRVHGLCRRTQSRRAAAGLHQPQLPPGLYRIRGGARTLGQRLGQRHDQFRPFGRPRDQYLYRRFEPFQQLRRFGANARFRRLYGDQYHPCREGDAPDGRRGVAAGQGRGGAQYHAGLFRRRLLHRKRAPCP